MPLEDDSFSLDEYKIDDIPLMSPTENDIRTAFFIENEVREVIFHMKHNKAHNS